MTTGDETAAAAMTRDGMIWGLYGRFGFGAMELVDAMAQRLAEDATVPIVRRFGCSVLLYGRSMAARLPAHSRWQRRFDGRKAMTRSSLCVLLRRLREAPVVHLMPIIVLLCILLMRFVDRPLALYCKTNLAPHWEGFFKVLTRVGEGWPWYAVAGGTILWGRLWGRKGMERQRWEVRSRAAGWLLAAMAGSGLVVEGLKVVFGRFRPRVLFEQGLYGLDPFGGLAWATQSFPSGHSQTIWAAMTVLALLRPGCRVAFFVVGGLVSASRVVTTVHFLSDVVMGAFLGITVALMFRDFFRLPDRS